jgi:DNA-binding protein HU-beta
MAKKESKAMTKTQLINHLSEKSELPKKKVAELMEELLAVAYKEAKKDHGFTLPGLGKLVVTKRSARTGRNPQTGEPIKIPAKKALKFRIAKQAKDAVLGVKKK